jgi:minor extracellular protease Epr
VTARRRSLTFVATLILASAVSAGCARLATRLACPEPDDQQWRTKYWGLVKIDACSAWNRVPDASGAIVAVVDSGIGVAATPHPDLRPPQLLPKHNKCPAGTDDDQDGHGTKVAGVIGGKQSGKSAVGVAWSATLRPYKFLCPSGFQAERAADALEAAATASPPPDVVNASWTVFPQPTTPYESHPVDDKALANIDRIITTSPRVLFVFAAPPGTGPYPDFAKRDNVLVVTASDKDDQLPRWAGRDPVAIHMAAPGVAIATADILSPGTTFQGSSAAAAFVSGCAALVKLAAKPNTLTASAVRKLLLDNADKNLDGLKGGVMNGQRLNCGKAVSATPR